MQALVSRGIHTGAIIRPGSMAPKITMDYLNGAEIIECDVSNEEDVLNTFINFNPTSTICCLASRSGIKKDSWAIDYYSSLNTLNGLITSSTTNPSKIYSNVYKNENTLKSFVLLSAYCCGKPELQFQYAKLKLEEK